MPTTVTAAEMAQTNIEDEMDNPFRPGSELSREADIIVNLIKEGKPITPTMEIDSNGTSDIKNDDLIVKQDKKLTTSSPVNGATQPNGTSAKEHEPGEVDVQHGIIVPPSDKLQTVEQVTLKKKRKCCCTIQ